MTNRFDSLRRRANARNVSFRISLQRPIHIINPVDETKLSCYTSHKHSTTVSLETYPSICHIVSVGHGIFCGAVKKILFCKTIFWYTIEYPTCRLSLFCLYTHSSNGSCARRDNTLTNRLNDSNFLKVSF